MKIYLLQSFAIKLETSEDDKNQLLDVMKRFNEAASYVADEGFYYQKFGRIGLHDKSYYTIRATPAKI